ncbi:MAG: ABC transporter ATP-binding protein [Spirochaetales bacterium]|nr:ABC transporter ATP-binding protein [Spirochaetales bacterium]
MELLECSSLSKSFGSKTVLAGFSFSVKKNECIGLFGTNGAGKSTLVNIICGLLRPDTGMIQFNGNDTQDPRFRWNSSLGIVLENCGLFEYLNIREHILFCAQLHNIPGETAEQRTNELLDILDLERFSSTLLCESSQGMRKKTAIASALVHSPELLVLDEALNGLDTRSVSAFRSILEYRKNTAVLITSHSLSDAEKMIDRSIIISDGRKLDDSPVEYILRNGSSLEEHYLSALHSGSADFRGFSWL